MESWLEFSIIFFYQCTHIYTTSYLERTVRYISLQNIILYLTLAITFVSMKNIIITYIYICTVFDVDVSYVGLCNLIPFFIYDTIVF